MARGVKRSLAAQSVAREVLATIGRGKRPIIQEIAISKGYAPTTAGAGIVQNTASYKEIINPAIARMEAIRTKTLVALDDKDLSQEKVQTLTTMLSSLTHDIQLLSGKATQHVTSDDDKTVILNILASIQSVPLPKIPIDRAIES